MKDKLEKYVTENKASFDVYEPGEDAWNKIASKIKKTRVYHLNYKTVLVRVAAVLIIFFSSYYFHSYMHNRKNNERFALKDKIQENLFINPEMVETEAYYTNLVSDKLVELRQYTNTYPEIENDVKYDLNELDSVYTEIKKDLKDNVANDEVIEAMIQNYRLKLKILEDLLEQLKQSQNSNQNEQQIHEI